MSKGIIYNIQRMSTKDGPGIRTTVFLKGCPLRCLWCSNPESQSFKPQLMFFEKLCVGCGACVKACTSHAIKFIQGKAPANPDLCITCGKCADVCPTNAREVSGKEMSTENVMRVLHQDSLFYENSGGGITFGGGEPTAGGEFFLDLLRACADQGWHTAVDTCGFCSEEHFNKTIALADMFLFDCKHMIPEEHEKLTGQNNVLILKNMQAVFESKKEIHIRMPLMPGLNDSKENIGAMADFLKKYNHTEVEIMPCHTFGWNKYSALNKIQPNIRQYSPDELAKVRNVFETYGLKTVIA